MACLYIIRRLMYDAFRHRDVHIPVFVTKNIWTYNFGLMRLIYVLTFGRTSWSRSRPADMADKGGASIVRSRR
jgi:hypothetical protein